MRRFGSTLLLGCALVGCDDGEGGATGAFAGRFEVEITNVSGDSSHPTGLAPGAWALHLDPDPWFDEGEPDRGEGLEALAEDGAPALFARGALAEGFFTADGGDAYADAPLHPGETLRFEIEGDPTRAPRLSLAMMLGESNDRFLAPEGAGIALFDADGAVIPEQEIADRLIVWDAGTEADQPLGEGADQAPRQATRGQGRPEGVVAPTHDAAPPIALTVAGGGVRIACPAPIASFLWIMHGDDFSPVEAFAPASAGLLALAGAGETAPLLADWPVDALLVGAHAGADSVSAPIDPARPWLSLIGRLADAPDRFVMTDPVRLVDAGGAVRAADAVAAEVAAATRIWSTGPEPAVVRRVLDWPPADQLVRIVIRAL